MFREMPIDPDLEGIIDGSGTDPVGSERRR